MHINKSLICCSILAGGLSSRMGGGIKSFNKFNNERIFDRILKNISTQVNQIVINTNRNNEFDEYKLTIINDIIKGHLGPLAGIHASLNWINKNLPHVNWLLSIPSDTPFLPKNLAERLYLKAINNNKKIVLATSNNRTHPVIGLWHCDLVKDLEKSLRNKIRKIIFFAEKHSLGKENFKNSNFDPFFNINFKEDLKKAKEIEDNYLL